MHLARGDVAAITPRADNGPVSYRKAFATMSPVSIVEREAGYPALKTRMDALTADLARLGQREQELRDLATRQIERESLKTAAERLLDGQPEVLDGPSPKQELANIRCQRGTIEQALAIAQIRVREMQEEGSRKALAECHTERIQLLASQYRALKTLLQTIELQDELRDRLGSESVVTDAAGPWFTAMPARELRNGMEVFRDRAKAYFGVDLEAVKPSVERSSK